jgi:hypothetical protein
MEKSIEVPSASKIQNRSTTTKNGATEEMCCEPVASLRSSKLHCIY